MNTVGLCSVYSKEVTENTNFCLFHWKMIQQRFGIKTWTSKRYIVHLDLTKNIMVVSKKNKGESL